MPMSDSLWGGTVIRLERGIAGYPRDVQRRVDKRCAEGVEDVWVKGSAALSAASVGACKEPTGAGISRTG